MELWKLAWFEVFIVKNKIQVHIDILYIVTIIDHVEETAFEEKLDGGLMTFKHYQTNNIHVTVEGPLEAMKEHNKLNIQITWRCDML